MVGFPSVFCGFIEPKPLDRIAGELDRELGLIRVGTVRRRNHEHITIGILDNLDAGSGQRIEQGPPRKPEPTVCGS
jgi:hypothetical protein